jgi:hypothetical protein
LTPQKNIDFFHGGVFAPRKCIGFFHGRVFDPSKKHRFFPRSGFLPPKKILIFSTETFLHLKNEPVFSTKVFLCLKMPQLFPRQHIKIIFYHIYIFRPLKSLLVFTTFAFFNRFSRRFLPHSAFFRIFRKKSTTEQFFTSKPYDLVLFYTNGI